MADITFLGTGDAFGSGGFSNTSFLIRCDITVLIDCGCSVMISMNRYHQNSDDIDLVLITHFHADHFGGLPFLLLEQHYKHRKKALRVIGPPGIEEKTRQLVEVLFPSSNHTKYSFPIHYIEYAPRVSIDIDPNISITAFPVEHVPETKPFALRFRCGEQILTFSGDTTWTDTLIEAADKADVFICECFTYETPTAVHLDYKTLLKQSERINAKKILLTHCSNDVLKRKAELKFQVAEEGSTVTF